MHPEIKEEIIGEVDDGVIAKIIHLYDSTAQIEESQHVIWILTIFTPYYQQNLGQAKALIREIKSRNKRIEWGVFTEDGEKYLSRYQ